MLTELSKKIATVLAYSWKLHHATSNYNGHLRLNDVYQLAIESVDRVCECAEQHNHPSIATVDCPKIEMSIENLKLIIGEYLSVLKNCSTMDDLGIQNMCGDEYEKWSKWKDYFLRMTV